ncbi:hypothetical protein [Anaeromyxobacter diazotrophicus]|uniref:Uncharacterized protein n=1 Tax=Anaeromyxobacter diazotrophicus TaxID=2590199 RepID=A0A7I9VQ28_9BACT|nr:hypothetical protein [Anaeromyxobacter diazotrophicus]GEJ58495.1 hypothetical protein AMYX_32360 [Anaeromyxobacter diazotrophicus]
MFSQYGDVESLKRFCESRHEVFAALQEVPAERRVYTPADGPKELLLDGKVALERDLSSR